MVRAIKDTVAGFACERGTKTAQTLKVAVDDDGRPVSLSVFLLRGVSDGPTLLLNALIHGDEPIGADIVKSVIENVHPDRLKGTLIAVPVVNVKAYEAGLRYDPVDGVDMNRVFPGDSKGTMTERVAHGFFNEIAKKAGYIIDIHSAEDPEIFLSHARIRAKDPGGMAMKMVHAFGTELVWEHPGPDGMFQVNAIKNDIPTVTVEIGSESGSDKGRIEWGVDGVFNVLKILGMIDGKAMIPDYQIIIRSQRISLKSPVGGGFERRVELGDAVEEGDVLGRIIDLEDGDEMLVKSPADCIVAGLHNHPSVKTGTRLFFLLPYKKAGNEFGIDTQHLIKAPELQNTRFRENKLLKKIMERRDRSRHSY